MQEDLLHSYKLRLKTDSKGEFMKIAFISALSVLAAVTPLAGAENPKVILDTTKGQITIELYPGKAPDTVKNFLAYVDAGFYSGTVFHRVMPNFMIQGGGFAQDMQQKPTRPPIKIESDNGLKNLRGTIAMARTQDPNSATAQFFISSADNDFLNFKDKTTQGWGYAVFGKVVQGMEVVDEISKVKTGAKGSHRDVPVEPVLITTAKRAK
jgi:peptidyl-prolyl cis-trans isomerase B (cyclophilin B)